MVYQKLEVNSYTADELLLLLKNKKRVLLEVRVDTFDFTCSVTSYAYTAKGLYVYQPSHCLMTLENMSEEKVVVDSIADWTENFISEDAFIGIDDESYFHCEYANDLDQIKVILSQLKKTDELYWETELYLSDDYGNFYGPLECDFIEWWIKNHKGYHTDTISAQVGSFEITENGTLLKYTGKDEELVKVPNGVKRIGTGAFRFCKAKQIILPEGILLIASEAFEQSRELETINIPSSVIQIGDSAFYNCKKLKSVFLPPYVKKINAYTFSGCSMLNSVVFSDSIEIIDFKAFQDCCNLEEIRFPESMEEIRTKAFSGCLRLCRLSFSKKPRLGFAAFEGCTPEIEKLSSSFLVSKGRLLEASHFLKHDIQIPNNVHTLAADPHRDFILGGKTLYDNVKIRTLILPKGIIKAELMSLPRQLEYLIIRPGKRNFLCNDDILNNSNAKIVFHFGKNIVMKSSYRWCDEPLVFVSFASDKVLLSSNNEPMSDDIRRYRLIVKDICDVKQIVEQYHLSEIPVIMNYLSEIFECELT